jgi:hypothetical protein
MTSRSYSNCSLPRVQYAKRINQQTETFHTECCLRHKCSVNRCFGIIHSSTKYCINHQNCKYPNCKKVIYMNSQYHRRHKRISCSGSILKNDSRIMRTCFEHTCSYCQNPIIIPYYISYNEKNYCSQNCSVFGEAFIIRYFRSQND